VTVSYVGCGTLTVTNVDVMVSVTGSVGKGSMVTGSVVHEPPLQKVNVVTVGLGTLTVTIVDVIVSVTPSLGNGSIVMTSVVQ
jgi:hypothetical protein